MKDKKGWVSFRYHAFVGWKDQEMKILEFIRLWARTVPVTDIFSKDIIKRSGQKFQHLNNFAHLWSPMLRLEVEKNVNLEASLMGFIPQGKKLSKEEAG